MRKQLSILSGVALAFALMFVPRARASERDQASKLTFNQPIEIPGPNGHRVLAAGTYWFVTPEDMAERNLVQIFNADRTKLITTVPTISVDRPNISDHTEMDLARSEARANTPNALVSWFYPDRTIGHGFVYGGRQQNIIESEPQMKVMAQDENTAYGD